MRRSSGFTLVELLVVILVLGLLFTITLSILVYTIEGNQAAEGLTREQRVATAVNNLIARDLSFAFVPIQEAGGQGGPAGTAEGITAFRGDERHFSALCLSTPHNAPLEETGQATGTLGTGSSSTSTGDEEGPLVQAALQPGSWVLRTDGEATPEPEAGGGFLGGFFGDSEDASTPSGALTPGWVLRDREGEAGSLRVVSYALQEDTDGTWVLFRGEGAYKGELGVADDRYQEVVDKLRIEQGQDMGFAYLGSSGGESDRWADPIPPRAVILRMSVVAEAEARNEDAERDDRTSQETPPRAFDLYFSVGSGRE